MSLHAGPETAALRARFAARLAVLRTCAGRTCRLRPALRLHVRRQQCRFVAAVRGADTSAIEMVRFTVRRRSFARDARAPFRRRVKPIGVRPGRRFALRARVRLDDGRVVTLDRRGRTCAR